MNGCTFVIKQLHLLDTEDVYTLCSFMTDHVVSTVQREMDYNICLDIQQCLKQFSDLRIIRTWLPQAHQVDWILNRVNVKTYNKDMVPKYVNIYDEDECEFNTHPSNLVKMLKLLFQLFMVKLSPTLVEENEKSKLNNISLEYHTALRYFEEEVGRIYPSTEEDDEVFFISIEITENELDSSRDDSDG